MLHCEDRLKLQVFLSHLNDSVGMLGMRFAPSRRKALSQDWMGWKPNLVLTGKKYRGGWMKWLHLIWWLYVGSRVFACSEHLIGVNELETSATST